VPYKGSDGETSSEVEDPTAKLMEDLCKSSHAGGNLVNDDTYSQIENADLLDREQMENQFKKMQTKMKSSKNLRGFLQGMQFYIK